MRHRGAAALVVLMAFSAACSEEVPDAEPAAACSLAPEIETPEGIPDDFPWPRGISVTKAELTKQFVTISGYSEQTVEELFEVVRVELIDKRFDIVNTDYEGFEAELYFAKSDTLAGIAALREAPCDGYVKVDVVYDPLDTKAGRHAVRKTRRLTEGTGAGN